MTSPVARILCVDDDKDCCELIEYMLRQENAGYDITSVSGVREALDLIAHQSFDLYILDYIMPHGSGEELCRKIRQADLNTPIMFYSAMARKIDEKEAIAAGANEYLVKPQDLDRFTETVGQLLNISRSSLVNESSTSRQSA